MSDTAPSTARRIVRGLVEIVTHPRATRQQFREQFGRFAGPCEGVAVSVSLRCENAEYRERLLTLMNSYTDEPRETVPFSTARRITTTLCWPDTDIESALSQTPTALRRVAARARVPFDELVLESIVARGLEADHDTHWIDDLLDLSNRVRSPDVQIESGIEAAEDLAEGVSRLIREARIDRSSKAGAR